MKPFQEYFLIDWEWSKFGILVLLIVVCGSVFVLPEYYCLCPQIRADDNIINKGQSKGVDWMFDPGTSNLFTFISANARIYGITVFDLDNSNITYISIRVVLMIN